MKNFRPSRRKSRAYFASRNLVALTSIFRRTENDPISQPRVRLLEHPSFLVNSSPAVRSRDFIPLICPFLLFPISMPLGTTVNTIPRTNPPFDRRPFVVNDVRSMNEYTPKNRAIMAPSPCKTIETNEREAIGFESGVSTKNERKKKLNKTMKKKKQKTIPTISWRRNRRTEEDVRGAGVNL